METANNVCPDLEIEWLLFENMVTNWRSNDIRLKFVDLSITLIQNHTSLNIKYIEASNLSSFLKPCKNWPCDKSIPGLRRVIARFMTKRQDEEAFSLEFMQGNQKLFIPCENNKSSIIGSKWESKEVSIIVALLSSLPSFPENQKRACRTGLDWSCERWSDGCHCFSASKFYQPHKAVQWTLSIIDSLEKFFALNHYCRMGTWIELHRQELCFSRY